MRERERERERERGGERERGREREPKTIEQLNKRFGQGYQKINRKKTKKYPQNI